MNIYISQTTVHLTANIYITNYSPPDCNVYTCISQTTVHLTAKELSISQTTVHLTAKISQTIVYLTANIYISQNRSTVIARLGRCPGSHCPGIERILGGE